MKPSEPSRSSTMRAFDCSSPLIGGRRILAQAAQGGKAVHAGKQNIEEDQVVGGILACQLQTGFGIAGGDRFILVLAEHPASGS
ncbi:MAG: hypothetical protein ABR561_07615 [Guyparkeria sp.]